MIEKMSPFNRAYRVNSFMMQRVIVIEKAINARKQVLMMAVLSMYWRFSLFDLDSSGSL